MDTLFKENAISAGTDKTVRFWKIQTDTQLIFRYLYSFVSLLTFEKSSPQRGAIDCVSLINEEKFLSGAQDGYF